MKHLNKGLFVAAILALAACDTGADRFGSGSGSGVDQFANGGLGSVSDPTSPAYFQQTIGDRVLFVVDQSNLTDVAQATLREQAAWLIANPEYTAIIEGHADERGTREYNLALGSRRASAAHDFLVSLGVASNRLRTVTYGKERPVEICSDEGCYAQNRRAVTVLAAGGLS